MLSPVTAHSRTAVIFKESYITEAHGCTPHKQTEAKSRSASARHENREGANHDRTGLRAGTHASPYLKHGEERPQQ